MAATRSLLFLMMMTLAGCAGGKFCHVPASPAAVQTREFADDMATAGKAAWTKGNAVRTLENGDGFFPPMLRAAASAKRSITFECYTARHCQPLDDFCKILAERARAGVKVHVILDAFGCNHWHKDHTALLKQSGVQIEFYSPLSLLLPHKYNHRTHRRVLVVDGRVGFCGGAGWAYNWTGCAKDPEHWRDTQYELHGPVVSQLQDNFLDNWKELRGVTLSGPDYFPTLPPAGPLIAQMIAGSPMKQCDTIGATNLLAFRAARKSIRIEQSYFLPNAAHTTALIEAALRGVKVEIILPGAITDMPLAKEIMLGTLRRMMKAGISIYEFEPTMLHSKLVVVDEHLVIAGSGNLDARSFFHNDENNLHVLSTAFAREQTRMFERDKARSIRLTEATLKLPLWRRVRGFFGQVAVGVL